ncbi:MAG: hypothetical protein AAFZ18_12860 [Myxococcota bacterium]
MEHLSPQARAMLDQALDSYAPSAMAKARVRAELAAAIGAPPRAAVLEAEKTLTGSAASGPLAALGLASAGLGLTLLFSALSSEDPAVEPSMTEAVSTGASSYAQIRYAATSPAEPSPRHRAIVPVRATPQPAAPVAREVQPSEPPEAPQTEARFGSEVSSLAEEARLLGEARAALRDGQPELALNRVDEHARRFSAGALRIERFAAEALAACALGDAARTARAEAELRRLDPGSPHLKRVELCR